MEDVYSPLRGLTSPRASRYSLGMRNQNDRAIHPHDIHPALEVAATEIQSWATYLQKEISDAGPPLSPDVRHTEGAPRRTETRNQDL